MKLPTASEVLENESFQRRGLKVGDRVAAVRMRMRMRARFPFSFLLPFLLWINKADLGVNFIVASYFV